MEHSSCHHNHEKNGKECARKKDHIVFSADSKGTVMNAVEPLLNVQQAAQTDPDGSWTGAPITPDEKPVQDADDL